MTPTPAMISALAAADGHGDPPRDIDEYLARVPEPARSVLEALRQTIRAAAPMATEAISYQLPTFRYLGLLVSFGAAAKHCALYGVNATVRAPFADELQAFSTSKGTIRFTPDAPLPADLVQRLVAACLAQNEARAKERASRDRAGAQGGLASK